MYKDVEDLMAKSSQASMCRRSCTHSVHTHTQMCKDVEDLMAKSSQAKRLGLSGTIHVYACTVYTRYA